MTMVRASSILTGEGFTIRGLGPDKPAALDKPADAMPEYLAFLSVLGHAVENALRAPRLPRIPTVSPVTGLPIPTIRRRA